ncbi:MAG: tetratricopeptide repeat protein [Gemmatimonadales bacterium]
MRSLPFARLLLGLTLLVPATVSAQQDALTRGFELERRGEYAEAARAYQLALKTRPTEVGALLGLERTLTALNRVPEMVPQVQAAVGARPRVSAVYSLALRVWSAADRPDSARKVVEVWSDVLPNDETPFREWAALSLARRDRQEARWTFELARQRLGRDDVLAAEMAQVALIEEDYTTAAREWTKAVRRLPGYRIVAINSLGGVSIRSRDAVIKALDAEGSPEANQTAAALLARWGRPVEGFERLQASLPGGNPTSIELLRQFLDVLQPLGSRDARRAQGMAYEAISERAGGSQAARYRLDAARAYADAGDSEAAHRMLARLASDGNAPATLASDAAATLIGVLLTEGKVEQAAADLARHRSVLSVEQQQILSRRLALGYARAGRLDRAQAAMAGDSSVDGLALAGRLRLFQGDLRGATELFQSAGPFAGTREEATERASVLALLQPIQQDSLPELGQVFLALEQSDTTRALQLLRELAPKLPAGAGGAELWLMTARLLDGRGDLPGAEKAYEAAATSAAPATAPAAMLGLARLMASSGRINQAQSTLEQLILNYPQSAVVPQARRLLDELKGAVPRT